MRYYDQEATPNVALVYADNPVHWVFERRCRHPKCDDRKLFLVRKRGPEPILPEDLPMTCVHHRRSTPRAPNRLPSPELVTLVVKRYASLRERYPAVAEAEHVRMLALEYGLRERALATLVRAPLGPLQRGWCPTLEETQDVLERYTDGGHKVLGITKLQLAEMIGAEFGVSARLVRELVSRAKRAPGRLR